MRRIAVITLLLVSTGLATAQTAGLMHRYSFTVDANDSIGTAHGTLMNGATIANGALNLDGVGAFLDLPNNLVTGYTAITIDAWIVDDGSGTWARIYDFGNNSTGIEGAQGTGTQYMFLSLPAGGGVLRNAYTASGAAAEQRVDATRPAAGQKTHITWTSDGATHEGRLYINGMQAGISTNVTLTPADLGPTVNDWLGRSQFNDPYFRGSIDEFRIYDVALSAGAVLTNDQAGPDKLLGGPVHFVAQPQSLRLIEGQNAALTADVDGSAPISLRWFRNGSPVNGGTNFALNFPATLADNGAAFRLWATNVFTNVTFVAASSNAVLTVMADTNPPVLLRVQSASTSGVEALFSEPILFTTATNRANYTLTGPGGPVSITSASLDAAGTLISLTTPPMTLGGIYTLTVNNLRDRAAAGNVIAPGSQQTFVVTIYTVRDVGLPATAGAISPSDYGFGFTAAGAGVGGTSDQFSFAYETRTGDFDVQVALGALALSDTWASAGLMARDGLGSNAMFAASFATPGAAGSFFQSRTNAGAVATRTGSFPVNYPNTWLRLKRAGNAFTGYASLDGAVWSLLGSATFTAPATLQVGIAITSHNPAQSTFAGLTNTGNTVSTTVANVALPFEPPGPSSRRTGLVISEIMYHPQNPGTNSLEFVELYNSDLIAEDLSGYRLSGSIDYTLPPGTTLSPDAYLVVARQPSAVAAFYGLTGVLGPFTNNLPNDSGTVRLRSEFGSVLLEVNYGSKAPWPVSPDGGGHSLVLRRASYGERDPRAWAASDLAGGSPGRADGYGPEPWRGVVINEILAHTDLPDVDTIELFNAGNQPVNLLGCVLTDNPDTNKFVIGNVTIPARGFAYFTESQLGFALDASGETIWLKNPARTRVLDAVRFDAQENGVSFGRYPDASDRWSRLSAKTFGSHNAAPRISQLGFNEIMYHPITGDDSLQYVELFNRGPGALNIGGWKLKDGISFTFATNTIVPASGYLVIANDRARLLANYPGLNISNTVGNFGGKLAHGGEHLALTMPDTIVATNDGVVTITAIDIAVDEVTYQDGGRWGQWSDGGGSSLELIDPRGDKRDASNWADSDESAKAPWTLIERTALTGLGMGDGLTGNGAPNRFEFFLQGPGECLVDDVEVLSNGGTNRVINPGFESGTTGWVFQGTHNPTTLETGQAFSGSQSLHVRATERGDTGANRIRTAITLMPVGDANQATLRARVRWLRGDPNILLRLRGNWMECAGLMTLPSNLGTPGAANSRLVSNAGPAIAEVAHFPVLPAANNSVVVTARVNDPDGVAGVTLYYRVDPATTYTTLTMLDDGTGGDAFANDGIYSATLPGQPANTLVAFYLRAQDGKVSPATASFPNDAPARECLVNWGETLRTGNIGSYRLWLTAANLSSWSSREKNSNKGIDATFVYGNWRAVYNAETLYSGSPWHTPSYNGPLGSFLCNYDVHFPKDDTLLGVTEFTLEGQALGESSVFNNDLTAQAEATAYWMARSIGLRPNHRRYVHVAMNGQPRGLIYHDAQQPNGDVVEEHFPDDAGGNLHKIEDWFEFDNAGAGQSVITARLLNYTLDDQKSAARYRWNFRPRAAENPNDFTNLFALADAVATNVPAPEPYTSSALALMNVNQWMRVFALQHMAGNWDCYGYRRGKNMYAYKPPDSRWELLLWDVQLVFGKSSDSTSQNLFDLGNPGATDQYEPMIARMYSHPPFVREFWAALEDLVNGPMLPENYSPVMDARFAALRANDVLAQEPSSIKNWINARRAYILTQLPQAQFSVAGPGTFSSSSNTVVLTGTAPIGAGAVVVNGAAYPLTWTSITNWSLRVPLGAGANVLSIQALDRNGNVIAGTTNAVNYTGAAPTPEGAVVFNEILVDAAAPGAEFVELYNSSASFAFDLSGWSVNGLSYTFPTGAFLGPRSFLVLANDPYVFATVYGATNPAADRFDGNLDADGETLSLLRPGPQPGQELVVDRVRYETAWPWPAATNGMSLQLADAAQDNSRVANWRIAGNAAAPQWVFVSASGVPRSVLASRPLYIYLQSAGDIFIDDVSVVSGTVPAVGMNLVTNGGFEGTLSPWTIGSSGNNSASTVSTAFKHSGNSSLHLVASSGGSSQSTAIWQDFSMNLTVGATYTLGFWYLPSTNGGPLTVRFSNNGILITTNPAPFAAATPGTANSIVTTLPAFPSIWLNEVQPDNVTGPSDNFGERDPWIELRNSATNALSLDGLYLANNPTNLAQWAFPSNVTIPAGGFLLVWCDNQTNQTVGTNLHAAFRPSAANGTIALARLINGAPQLVDYLVYTDLPSNWSYGDFPDGQPFYRGRMFLATPRAANTNTSPPLTVFINEWMADNAATLADPADSQFEDWVELYNPGGATVDLGGYWLTDNLTNQFQYQIPNNGHYTIPPGGYLLVWADNETGQNNTNRADLHASFALNKGGEAIGLFASDGTTIDAVSFGAQAADVSQGRFPNGAANIFSMPTPTPRAGNVIPNTAPVLAAIGDKFIHFGQTLQLTAAASDAEDAFQTLAFALVAGPPGAAIQPLTGVFAWTATNVAVLSTNTVTIQVCDDGTPPLCATRTFYVIVREPPRFTETTLPGDGTVRLSFTTLPGQNYRLEYKNDLLYSAWLPLAASIAGDGNTIQWTENIQAYGRRFYRLVVLP